MEREGRGGIGMGNTCKPMAVSFQCMTKFTTKKKKKKTAKKNFNVAIFIYLNKWNFCLSHLYCLSPHVQAYFLFVSVAFILLNDL